MIVSINFADENFEKIRSYNTKSAYLKGKVDKVIEYSPTDIDLDFINSNSNIFAYQRGFGLWLWKPYFILKTLKELNDGEYLFYCDAGAVYVNKVQYLIDFMEEKNQAVLGFELPLIEQQFTKKETCFLMNYSQYSQNQILGSYILFKKSEFAIDFVQEWLNNMMDERISSPKYFLPEINEFNDFVAHREDQSVFSILYHQKKLNGYRDPSQYGDRPFEYKWSSKYKQLKEWSYQPVNNSSSTYPRIILLTRGVLPIKFKIKEYIKDILSKVGLYSETSYSKNFI